MEDVIKEVLLKHQEQIFQQSIPESCIQFQKTRKDVNGDFTLVLFPFVKMLKTSPQAIGEKVGEFLKKEIKELESFEVVGGFLNLSANSLYWWTQLSAMQGTKFAFPEPKSKSKLMVEYSSPNTNKPLHLGHLRNNFLGHSVARILEGSGHDVLKTQIVNDRGIHICKSMLAWEKFAPTNEGGQRETPQSTGLKGDKLVGKYYVRFDQEFVKEAKEIWSNWENGNFDGYDDITVTEFNKFQEAKAGKDEKVTKAIDSKILDLAKNQTTLYQEAKDMLVKWEAKDPQTYLLWSTMNGWVYEGFAKTYEKMGVEFDKLYYESDTYLIGKDLVIDGLNNGVFFKKDDGSIWVDLTAEGLDEKLILRSDGTAVYMTQDLGTAFDRYRDYSDLNGIIYTVGNEQDYHFKVLFLILEKLGFEWAKNCRHLSYGMVDLPSGKMKSREGTVVDADDLIDEVIQKAKEATMDRGHIDGMSEQEIDELCRMIGLGGLKYYLLKVDPKKRMLFNPEESIELNGNTGPFIQYAHARIKSILRKESAKGIHQNVALLDPEKEIIKLLAEAPKTLEEASLNMSPALIANYIYELVKAFNNFYQNVSIFKEENEEVKSNRLVLCQVVGDTIKDFMFLMGIDVPEKM